MSQFEKLWERFLLVPSDFTYEELRKIMKHYGYIVRIIKGKHLVLE